MSLDQIDAAVNVETGMGAWVMIQEAWVSIIEDILTRWLPMSGREVLEHLTTVTTSRCLPTLLIKSGSC